MRIKLLGTSGCHLCDVAERTVRRIAPAMGYTLEYVDIASNDGLVDKYGMQIPLLCAENGQELGWPFEEEQLIHWLESLSF